MKQDLTVIKYKTIQKLSLPIILSILYLIFTYAWVPFQEKISFSVDEGFEMQKGYLLGEGYRLYSEISSDQPPLFSYILLASIKLFGFKILPNRILVLLSSTIIVFSSTLFLQNTNSKLAALLFLPICLLNPNFISNSTMIRQGIPGLAAAMVSLPLIQYWHNNENSLQKTILLGTISFLITISVYIKLITVYYYPIIFFGILMSQLSENTFNLKNLVVYKPSLQFLGFSVFFVLVFGAVSLQPNNISDLFTTHLVSSSSQHYSSSKKNLLYALKSVYPILLLSCFGVIMMIRQKKAIFGYPLAAATFPIFLFIFHRPVNLNYLNYILTPMAMLSSISLADSVIHLRTLVRNKKNQVVNFTLSILCVTCFLYNSGLFLSPFLSTLRKTPKVTGFTLRGDNKQRRIITILQKYKSRINWVVTDEPTLPVYIQRPVPPILATFSLKRIVGGETANSDFIGSIVEYRPEIIILIRNDIPNLRLDIQPYVSQDYIQSDENIYPYELYIRKDILIP